MQCRHRSLLSCRLKLNKAFTEAQFFQTGKLTPFQTLNAYYQVTAYFNEITTHIQFSEIRHSQCDDRLNACYEVVVFKKIKNTDVYLSKFWEVNVNDVVDNVGIPVIC